MQVRQKSREFLEQEAQIRYEAYQEIQQHVATFCQSYGIQLVIRFNREPIDASKPQEVQMGLNRPIVYQNSLDITQHIIDSLNPTAAAAAPQTPQNVGRAPAIPRTHEPLSCLLRRCVDVRPTPVSMTGLLL